MGESELARRRRRRGSTNPVVWIAAIAVAVVVSGLAIFLATRSDGGAASTSVAQAPAKKARRAPDCEDVSERAAARHSLKVAEVTLTRCREDGWSEKVRRCVVKSESNEDYDACLDKLAPNQTKQLAVATAPSALSGSVAPKNVDTGCAFAADAFVKQLEQRSGPGTGSGSEVEAHFERITPLLWNAFAVSCTGDKWPSEAVDCIRRKAADEPMTECLRQLPRDVEKRFHHEVSVALGDLGAGGLPP